MNESSYKCRIFFGWSVVWKLYFAEAKGLARPGIRGKVAPPSEYLWLSLSLILGRDKTVAFTTSTLPLDQLTSRILIRKVISALC